MVSSGSGSDACACGCSGCRIDGLKPAIPSFQAAAPDKTTLNNDKCSDQTQARPAGPSPNPNDRHTNRAASSHLHLLSHLDLLHSHGGLGDRQHRALQLGGGRDGVGGGLWCGLRVRVWCVRVRCVRVWRVRVWCVRAWCVRVWGWVRRWRAGRFALLPHFAIAAALLQQCYLLHRVAPLPYRRHSHQTT